MTSLCFVLLLLKWSETNVFESENHFNRDFKTENNERGSETLSGLLEVSLLVVFGRLTSQQGGTNRANSVCQYCQQCKKKWEKKKKKKEIGGLGGENNDPK